MADNVVANAGSGGATFRAFSDGVVDWPANVISFVAGGSAGAWTLQQVDATHGLPVAVLGTVPVSGTFFQATQPVSAVSLPLPTGAATAAKQPALGTAGSASADVLSVQGIASMTALKVDGSGVTQPVSGTVTANQGGPWSVTVGAALPAGANVIGGVELVDSAGTNKASISAAGALKVDGSAVTQPVSGTVTSNIGTTNGLALDATLTGGSQKAVPVPASSGGASLSRTLSAATTNGTNVKGSAGTLYSVRASNFNTTSARFVKLYNKATAPTVGTDTVVDMIAIPAAISASQPSVVVWSGPTVGVGFSSGIGFGITGALADSDTTAIGANDVALTLIYN